MFPKPSDRSQNPQVNLPQQPNGGSSDLVSKIRLLKGKTGGENTSSSLAFLKVQQRNGPLGGLETLGMLGPIKMSDYLDLLSTFGQFPISIDHRDSELSEETGNQISLSKESR